MRQTHDIVASLWKDYTKLKAWVQSSLHDFGSKLLPQVILPAPFKDSDDVLWIEELFDKTKESTFANNTSTWVIEVLDSSLANNQDEDHGFKLILSPSCVPTV